MSGRLPTSRASIFLFLLVVASLAPFLAVPASAFGERVFESNTAISGANHLPVHSSGSVAQSFLATDTYRLYNLTLRLRNAGDTTDAISITIRTDAGGVPSNTVLASRQMVLGTNLVGNYNVVFPMPADVQAGGRYWIVATCTSLLLNAYEWHDSAGDAYAGGEAKINQNLGGGWVNPASPTDLYFVNFGRLSEANLRAAIVPLQPRANPGDLVTFRIYLNNSGNAAAPSVWLNDTQLPGFTYMDDSAAAAGATTPWPAFVFVALGNGARSFEVAVRVNLATEPGTVLTKALTLTYTDSTGAARGITSSEASILVGMRTKPLYLDPRPVGPAERLGPVKPPGGAGSQHNETLVADGTAHDFDLDPVLSRSFRVTGLTATLYLDSSPHDVRNLDINLTLADWNGVTLAPVGYKTQRVTTNAFSDYQAFTFGFPAIDHTFPSGGRIRLTVRNLGTSESSGILAMNSTFASSHLDLATTTYVRVDFLDMRDGSDSATAWSPKDSLIVQANVSDPFGSSEIAGARINITAPSGPVIVNYTAMALLATDLSIPSAWKLFRFIVAPPLAVGTHRVRVTAFERDGALDIAEGTALVDMPTFNLVKAATATNVGAGEAFTYHVWFNNTGTAPAGRVWINDTLPSDITFLGSSDPGAMTGNFNWTWSSIGVGNHQLSLQVQVSGSLPSTPYARNRVSLAFADEKGFSWPAQAAYADVAFRGPVIQLTKSSPTTALHADESITFKITMQNTGDPAQTLWVNDSLPAGLTYVSDTSDQIPGGTRTVSGNLLYFRFTDMPALATWNFTVTAIAAPGVVRGAILRNSVTLNYTNANGFLMPPRDAGWTVYGSAPNIGAASVRIDTERATPADIIRAVVVFTNDGNEPARDMWVNLSMDSNLTFLNASRPALVAGDRIRFTLGGVPLGTGSIFLNASVNATVADHRLLTIAGTITYTDGVGQLLPPVAVAGDGIETSAPRIAVTVTPSNTTVEAGDLVFYTVYQTNAGSGVAGNVSLTLPLPASFLFMTELSEGGWTVTGSTYRWQWVDFAPGTKSLSFVLKARPTVTNGTRSEVVFLTGYTDANGNLRTGVTTKATASFIAPRLDMVLTASAAQARPGETISFNLVFQNLGGSTVRSLWLTTPIESQFSVVSTNASVLHSGTGMLNWSFTDIFPGQAETVTIVLRIADGAPAGSSIGVAFRAMFTNSADIGLGNVSRSATVVVATDPTPLIWLGSAGVALAVLGALVIRRQLGLQIEEVFLVYKDGVLIYHLSRSLSQDKDEDVLSGMLTAVQEFVRDAFVYGERRNLLQLDFGDYRIMIERGRTLYLAVVYSGKGASSVRKRVRSVLDLIETQYGSVLEKWDGDMDKVVGARDLIREYLLKPTGRPFKGLPGLP